MSKDPGYCWHPGPWPKIFLGLSLLALVVFARAAAPDPGQRGLFLDAEQALRKNQIQRFVELRDQLRDYPLYPYLELQYLKKRISSVDESRVKRFLERHQGEPVADILRRKWLDRLAGERRWKNYLAFYTPQISIRRQCLYMQALIETGKKAQAWPLVEKIWLHGSSRPSACDPVFAAWEAAGKRSAALTWQRIELAMEAGQLGLARYLGKKLDAGQQAWVKRWISLYRDPRSALPGKQLSASHPYRETMLSHAVRHLARSDGLAALDLWHSLKRNYDFTATQVAQTERRIALALEREPATKAYAFINSLSPPAADTRLHTAGFRAALLRQDWPRLLERLQQWPPDEKASDRWKYWNARALEHAGQKKQARIFYQKAAQSRSYYGFLAADRIGAPYHLLHRQTPENPAVRTRLQQLPGVVRALELHALGRDVQARREWQYVIRKLQQPELKAAALIARESGWLDQAIFTLAKTGYWDDLELRFPLKYRGLVTTEAESHTLDMAWVYAVIRQESAFMRDAHSHAGALGLMQLMPATARMVARSLPKHNRPARRQLLEPSINIALGSAYLNQLKQQLQGNPVLATAAYNAGPHRVAKWLPSTQLPADIWVELVPFRETQRYIKRVLSYMVIYDKRLGRKPKRLQERMLPIVSLNSAGEVAGT